MTLAIFDLDYTMTKKGTWGRFVWMNVKSRPHLLLPLLISAGWTQWRYKQGRVKRVEVKKAMMKWCMTDAPRAKLLAMADKFAENEVANGLRPGAIAALESHKNAGDTIFIASAAVDIIVDAIAKRLSIEHTVSTEMDWSETGTLLPSFKSENCYGKEKLRRVQLYLTENEHLKHNHTDITMYSDSYSDLEILAFADLAIAVHPDKRLKRYAEKQNWRIENWN